MDNNELQVIKGRSDTDRIANVFVDVPALIAEIESLQSELAIMTARAQEDSAALRNAPLREFFAMRYELREHHEIRNRDGSELAKAEEKRWAGIRIQISKWLNTYFADLEPEEMRYFRV
jgi:CHAT domain-containing protein